MPVVFTPTARVGSVGASHGPARSSTEAERRGRRALSAARTARPGHLIGGKLIKTVVCDDFVAALAFVDEVGRLAEEANHHPDIDIRYNRVTLALMTHDAGGITQADLDLARAIDRRLTPVGRPAGSMVRCSVSRPEGPTAGTSGRGRPRPSGRRRPGS